MAEKPKDLLAIKKDLCYRLLLGEWKAGDVLLAQLWRNREPEAPIWVQVLAGGNPDKIRKVQEIAREELAHEIILGTEEA